MKLSDLPPSTVVRLFFKNEKGEEGSMVTTVEKALNPNRSGRFFPPDGMSAAQMDWPVPWWYAEECHSFQLGSY